MNSSNWSTDRTSVAATGIRQSYRFGRPAGNRIRNACLGGASTPTRGKVHEVRRTGGSKYGCGGATAQPLQTGALHGEQGPQADGGTAWRSAAAHRHDTRLRIAKQVRKFPTGACFFCGPTTRRTSRRSGLPTSSKLEAMAEFSYTDLLPLGHDETTYRKIAEGGVEATQAFGRSFLSVDPEALTLLSRTAFRDIAHL